MFQNTRSIATFVVSPSHFPKSDRMTRNICSQQILYPFIDALRLKYAATISSSILSAIYFSTCEVSMPPWYNAPSFD